MFDEFTPDVRKITLSPRNPMTLHRCQTIGYLHGDIPSIIVEVGGDPFVVRMGQCIPTGGREVAIMNPFSRTASAQISFNAAPQSLSSANIEEQRQFVTYRAVTTLGADASRIGDFRGVGLVSLGSGSFVLEYETTYPVQAIAYSHASPENLANKPSGFMDVSVTFDHLSVASMDTVAAMSGFYSYQQIVDWLAQTELKEWDKKAVGRSLLSGRILVEPNTAIVLKTNNIDTTIDVNMSIEELPEVTGVRNV